MNHTLRLSLRYVTAMMTLFFVLAVNAGAITITVTPSGLAPGSAYQLLFVTSTTIDATSADITVYNAHVMATAASIPALNVPQCGVDRSRVDGDRGCTP